MRLFFNQDGGAALLVAAQNNRRDMIEELLDHGVDIDVVDDDGRTALMYASQNGNAEIFDLLLTRRANVHLVSNLYGNALTIAVSNNKEIIAETLLENGVDANLPGLRGFTPLMIAAECHNTTILRHLLEARVNVDRVTEFGDTALTIAARCRATEAIGLLLGAGANVDHVTESGNTALTIAAREHEIEAIELLLGAGANVDHVTESGDTALIIAARNNLVFDYGLPYFRVRDKQSQMEVVRSLLDAGADVNHLNHNHQTALTAAAQTCNGEVVNLIINNVALSRRNDGEDWRIMSLGNQEADGNEEDDRLSQLVNGVNEANEPNRVVLDLLSRETVTILAIIIPSEELKNIIITNFNERNAENQLDQGVGSKIAKFQELKSSLEEKFLQEKHPKTKSALISSPEITEEDRMEAEKMAIIVVTDFLSNPSKITDFRNYYLEKINPCPTNSDQVLARMPDTASELATQFLIYNKSLNESQNLIVHRALKDFIFGSSEVSRISAAATESAPPPTVISARADAENIAQATSDNHLRK